MLYLVELLLVIINFCEDGEICLVLYVVNIVVIVIVVVFWILLLK